ncbi:hypothetical protein NFI96_031200 [Prochilodus magdalenae]|nr:hypothetical protein NFI96_031200 [Prochilodus magdalenae]
MDKKIVVIALAFLLAISQVNGLVYRGLSHEYGILGLYSCLPFVGLYFSKVMSYNHLKTGICLLASYKTQWSSAGPVNITSTTLKVYRHCSECRRAVNLGDHPYEWVILVF